MVAISYLAWLHDFSSFKEADWLSKICHMCHIVWKSTKISHSNLSILAISTNFCPIESDLSGKIVWHHVWHFYGTFVYSKRKYSSLRSQNETFSVIFKHRGVMQFSIIQSSCNLLSKKFSLSYAVVFGEVVWSLHEEQRSCVNFLLSCIYILHHLLECLESNRAHTEGSSSSKKQMRFWRLQEQAAAGKDNLICKLNRKGSGSFCPPFLLKMKMENEFS